MGDRIVTVLGFVGYALSRLRGCSDDDQHELAERVAVSLAALGPKERRLMLVASMMAAEPIDQEYIGWVLGGAMPLTDSKYPYWQMYLSRADNVEEDLAPFQRSAPGDAQVLGAENGA